MSQHVGIEYWKQIVDDGDSEQYWLVVLHVLIVSFFFFSSRRRHTRFDCDWSSDVCSSDLAAGRATDRARRTVQRHRRQNLGRPAGAGQALARRGPYRAGRPARHGAGARPRSEEHTSELQSQSNLVCRLLLEKKTKVTHTLSRMVPREIALTLTSPHPHTSQFTHYFFHFTYHHIPASRSVSMTSCHSVCLRAP